MVARRDGEGHSARLLRHLQRDAAATRGEVIPRQGHRTGEVSLSKSDSGINKVQYIYDKILDFGASIILLHIAPYEVYMTTACSCLPNEMRKCYINYTDHSFILGSTFVDNSIEFRKWGALITETFRGINRDNQLLLPFYPIMDEKTKYYGLPDICRDKIVVLSGGGLWKIIDDEDT